MGHSSIPTFIIFYFLKIMENFKQKIKQKKILIAVFVLIIIVFFGYFLIKKEKTSYNIIKAKKGEISQVVSESGIVKKGDEINLGFKSPGRIEKIFVKVGEKVAAGQLLAKLDTSQLLIQLKEAQSSLESVQIQYKKLLAGPSAEEIKIAQVAVDNAKISFESAKKNLEDIEKVSEKKLEQAYEQALNVLYDVELKSYNALETTRSIQKEYFPYEYVLYNDPETLKVKEEIEKMENFYTQIKNYLEKIKINPASDIIDSSIPEIKKILDSIYQSLSIVRQTCESGLYADKISSTDKASLDAQKTNIITVLTNVSTNQQNISLTKASNTSNINTAKNQVLSAEGFLKKAEEELSKLLAPARQEDIDLYKAKINQTQASVDFLKNQIEESKIISPTAGQITKIRKKAGEMVQLAEPVISFLSENEYQIEVDIYEEEIVKIKINDPAEIKFTALPGKIFKGKVISIDPTEEIIENVVYYKVTVSIEQPPSEIKPGMTTDVVIKTAQKENVLLIPKSAVKEKDGKKIVQILENKIIKEKEIQIGLIGNDAVEVVSGLKEDDELITE